MANQFIKTALPMADLNQAVANNDVYNGISAAKHQFVQDMSYDPDGSFNAASSALGTAIATETPEQSSAMARKANALAEATQRKRALLGDTQDKIDQEEFTSRLNNGEEATQIQADMDKKRAIRSKSPEERLANYLSSEPTFDDPEFANDVATRDDFSLRALYGDNVLEGIRRKKLQDIQDYNMGYGRERENSSWFNGRNIVGAITSGVGETVDALGSALNFATKSGEERLYAELNPYTAGKRLQEFGKEIMQKDYQDNEDVQVARSNLVDAFERDQYTKYRATMTDEHAKAQAKSDAEWLSVANALEDSKGIITELWQNIPDLVSSGGLAALSRMAVGGASKAMLEAEAKRQLRDLGKEGIKKEAKEMAAREAVDNLEKAATKAGTQVDAVTKYNVGKNASEKVTSKEAFDTVKAKKFDDALEKSNHRARVIATVGESIKSGFEESAGTYEQAAQTVLSMDSDQVANTKEGKKLKEQHPEWSDDKIKEHLAMKAGEKSYEYNVEVQSALGGVFAGPELRMFDKASRATGVKGKVGNYAKSIGSQAVEEGVGEGANTYASNLAVNKALGEDVVDTTKGIYADAVKGALSGGLSTGITNAGELMPAAKKAIAKPITAAAKVKQDQAKEKANLEFQSIVTGSSMPTQDTSIKGKVKSAVGKNSYDQDQVDELNSSYANTKFGALAEANKKGLKERFGIGEDEDVSFFELADQYDKQISKMTKDYIELDRKGESNLTLEEKATYDGLQEQVVAHHHYTVGLRQALEQDAVQAMQGMSEAEREAYIQSVNDNPVIAKIKGKTALENYLEAKEAEQQPQQSEDYSVQVNDQTTASVVDDTGSASIKKTVADFKDQVAKIDADAKLTSRERAALKSKLAKGMVASIKNIATRDSLDTDNITKAWASIGTMTKDIMDTLNDTDTGIEANTKNSLVRLLQYIHGTANAIENGEIPSKTEQLTQYEKLIGSAGRGRQMRGLLDYAQEALNNKGKLGIVGALELQHFRLTQQEKMNAAEKLLNDADEQNLFDGKGELKEGVKPLVLVNEALKNKDKRQRKQSGDDFTQFTNRKALQAYIKALKNDASLDGIFDSLSGKVSGSKATKNTTETKPKKETKPSKVTKDTNNGSSTTPTSPSKPTQSTTPKVDTKKLQQYLAENSEDFGYNQNDFDFAESLDKLDDYEIEIPDVDEVFNPVKTRNYDVSDLDDLFGSASVKQDTDNGSASTQQTNPHERTRVAMKIASKYRALHTDFTGGSVGERDKLVDKMPVYKSEITKDDIVMLDYQSNADVVNKNKDLLNSIVKVKADVVLITPKGRNAGAEALDNYFATKGYVLDKAKSDDNVRYYTSQEKSSNKASFKDKVKVSPSFISSLGLEGTEAEDLKDSLEYIINAPQNPLEGFKEFSPTSTMGAGLHILNYALNSKGLEPTYGNVKSLLDIFAKTGFTAGGQKSEFPQMFKGVEVNAPLAALLASEFLQAFNNPTNDKVAVINQAFGMTQGKHGNYYALNTSEVFRNAKNSLFAKAQGIEDSSVKGKSFTSTSIKDLAKDWDSTAEIIAPQYSEKYKAEYRLKGLDLTEKGATNILNNPDVKYSERIPLFNQETLDKINEKDNGVTEEQVLAGKYADGEVSGGDKYFLKGLAHLNADIKGHLETSILSPLQNPKKDAFNLNGFLNFTSIREVDGKRQVEMSNELLTGMVNALAETVSTPTISSKGSFVRESYTDNGANEITLVDITSNPNVSSEEAIKNYRNGVVPEILTTDYALSNLGTIKSEFISELGRKTLRNLGIKIDPNSDVAGQMEGLAFSLGTELFNYLHANGLVNVQRIYKHPPETPVEASTIFIDHVSFAWDSERAVDTKKDHFKRNKARNLFRKGTSFDDYKKAVAEFVQAKGDNTVLAMALLNRFNDTRVANDLFPNRNKGYRGFRSDKPYTVTNEDVKNVTTSGANSLQTSMIQAQNNIKFSFNVNNKGEGFANFALTNTNESFIKEWLGYTTDTSGNTTAITKSLTSKNNQLDRSFDIARYANDVLSVDNEGNEVALADRHAYLKHKAISTQRTMIDGDFNPQADKFHREIFVPTFTNPDGSRMEWGFNAKGFDHTNIAKEALDLYRNRLSIEDANHYDQVTGFALALAQALGVKIERNKVADALTKLDSILNSDDFKNALDSLSDRINGKESALPKGAIKSLGLDSPRALNAVYQLALMESGKGLNSKGQFQPMLMIEADGIGNGVHNNLRQFSTGFTENYLHTLKRTGVVPLDFIATAENPKELEGSREIFTSNNPNDTIDDVYNVVANTLTNKFQRFSTLATQYNIADNTLNELINSGFIEKIAHGRDSIGNLTRASEYSKATDKEITNLLKTLMVLNQTGNLENGDIGDIPLGQLGKLIVKRGVAKLAVTPSNYGGKRTGINNQVNGEFKSSYLNQLNDLYKAIKKDGLTSENEKAFDRLVRYGQTIHMAPFEVSYKSKEEVLGIIEDMSNLTPAQSAELTKFNYSGISTLLYEGIREVYGEQFKEVDAIIANDQMLYYAFEQEFLDKLNNFVKQRNIEKEWASYKEDGTMQASDSRAYDFPKAHELKEILGNLVNSPNVATAMSKDSQLINDLYHMGNSITKEQLLRNEHSMTTVTSVYLNPESNTHIGAVLNKSWKHFESSGPSLLTSSIVGTEAATQGYLAIEMEKNHTPTLDVYDGVEVWGFMRNFVGNKVNEITNQVHLDNSLMKSFYEKLARSNVGEMFLEHTVPEFRAIEKRFLNNTLTQDDAKKLKGMLGAYTSAWYIDNDDVNQEYEAVRTFLDRVIDSDGSTIEVPSKTASEALGRMIKREYNSIESGFLPTSYSLFEASLKKARERAIDNLAMKDIEREYLPVIINQFGGISNGYYHGEDMPKVVDTIKRFNEFMANHPDKSTTFRKDSKALAEFIAQDAIIQEALEKARAKHARNLPLKLPTNKMEAKPEYSKSATDLIKSIRNNLTGDNLDTRVLGSLLDAFEAGAKQNEKVYDRKLEVFNDFNEFLTKLPEDVRAKVKDMNLNGYYHPLAGIYINPVQFELGNMKDLVHELSHAALNSQINAHYLSKGTANPETTASINLIEAIAKDMAKLFAHDSRVINMVKELRNSGDFDVNSAYRSLDRVRATMANIGYVFDPQTAKGVDAITLAKAKAEAIKEFIAYGLTESEFLNRLESSGLRNRSKVLEETGFKAVMAKFKDLLNKFMDAYHRLLGFDHKNQNKSYLADIVRAVNVLTMDTTNYAKQNEVDEGNASVASTVANYEAVSQSAPVSDKHRAFLNELVERIKTRAPAIDVANFTEEREALENNDTDKQTNDFLIGLRNAGISVSPAEESAFRLAYASAKANFMGGNSNYVNTATAVVNDIMDTYDFSDKNINDSVFNSPVFAKDKEYNVPAILSAITTVEELKNKFDTKRSQKALDKANDFILTKALDLPKDSSTLESLALIAGSVNFRDKLGHLDKLELEMEEAKKEASKTKLIKDIDDIAKALPSDVLGKALVGAAGVILSGDNISDDGDSTIGKALQDYAESTSYLAGRPTLLSKILRYFRGSYSDVHYIYDMQNKASVVAEATREKIGNAVNAHIEKQFSNGISPEMDKTITDYMSTMVYKLKGSGINPFDPINNYGQIKSMIKNADTNLQQVVSTLPVQDKEGLMNFLRWQAEGLADLIRTGSSKANSETSMTSILSNTRAITSLTLYSQMSGEKVNLTDDQKVTLKKAVDALVALHNVDKLGSKKVEEIRDLIKAEPKGMNYINQELSTLDDISSKTDTSSVFGYDGYSHSKRNPHQDYVIVSKGDDETAKRLSLQGYKVSATLPNGERVFTTNNSLATAYTNGALALTESSINGANIVTGDRLGDRTLDLGANNNSVQQVLRKEWANIRRNPSYYSGLQSESMYQPIMDRLGKVTGVKAALNNKLKDQFKETVEKGYESIGNYYARIGEERIVSNNNIEYVKQLNQAYQQDHNKTGYVKLDGKYKAKGNSNEDARFEKAINEFYYQLPMATRNYIDSIGGLYVKRNELDNIIGYSQASITDIFTGKSGLPDFIQKPVRAVATVILQDLFGMNPAQFLKYLERGFSEVAALSKDYVLVRSGIVPLQNILSNVIHLWNTGIPVNKIAPLMLEGYKEAKRYTELHKELLAARHAILVDGITPQEKERNRAKARALEVSLEKLSVAPLIRAGLLTSISDLSNDTVKEDDEFSLLTKAMEKSGIKEMRKHTPELVKSLMVYKGSKGHNIMSQFMDYGDFVAKYALYQHLTQGKGIDSTKAMNVVRDEFVNYSMNRGREFDWANKVGLTWFLSYKLAIQKIIYRNLRRNTLRTLATWAGGNAARNAGIDLIQTVPQQRLWFDYSGYHFEADNIYDNFKSHWLMNLL
nr:MAG TPA: RNA polymerase [Caudoviricetes sp.]